METTTTDTTTDPPKRPSPGDPTPQGLRPTPDPTRTGALWVGGAGVALLLAAAAVLTAVRWDEIGQSVKLGALVAITIALLAGGRRLQSVIPMTAQAIFHLGALLIPFDMAAVATLAGQTWQQTLLLTSVTSVAAWYGIHRAAPSSLLLWSARIGVIGTAAGIAAMTPIAMPLALVVAALAAVALRRTVAATLWSATAGLVPLVSLTAWPPRVADAMDDLGFVDVDRWQLLAAGILATLALVAATRLHPRLELAWASVAVGVVTVVVAAGTFGASSLSYVTAAVLFLGVELLAFAARKDVLWKPVMSVVALVVEGFAVAGTSLFLAYNAFDDIFASTTPASVLATAAALAALGWLTADRRRLDETTDWLTGMLVGSDWPVTTVMFPVSVIALLLATSASAVVSSLVLSALAYWMVSTWRTGASYGAVLLAAIGAVYAAQAGPWIELGLGAVAVAMLALATRLRIRAHDDVGAVVAVFAAILLWLNAADGVVVASVVGWPLLIAMVGAWALSSVIEARPGELTTHLADWVGRVTAVVLTAFTVVSGDPYVALAMSLSIVALAVGEYYLANRRGAVDGSPLLGGYALLAGAAFGVAGVPLGSIVGFGVDTTGVALAMASFVAVGIAVVMPQRLGLALGAVAGLTAILGLGMASFDPGSFAVALMSVGAAALLLGAALRDPIASVVGYVTVGLGSVLQLSVWEVDWVEPYLIFPAIAAVAVGYRHHQAGGSSWAAYVPTIAVLSYVALAARFAGGPAWHAVIAGTIGVLAIIAGGYRRLVGPLLSGTAVLAIVVSYESLGPAGLVPTWLWLAIGGTVLLSTGVALERTDTTPLERGRQLRQVVATQFS